MALNKANIIATVNGKAKLFKTKMNRLFSLNNISVTLGKCKALQNICWQAFYPESWAILGGNGAGKSTLLRLVLGEIWPDQHFNNLTQSAVSLPGLPNRPDRPDVPNQPNQLGQSTQPGQPKGHNQQALASEANSQPSRTWFVAGKPETSPLAIKHLVASVSPELQTWYTQHGWNLSGEELLLSGLYGSPLLYTSPIALDIAEITALAEELELNHLLDCPVASMSQGQLRSMLIARALAAKPAILALDEVFDGLDSSAKNALMELLEHLSKQQTSLLITAHRKEDLPPFIRHAIVLNNGQITFKGLLQELKNSSPSEKAPILPHFEAPAVNFKLPPVLELKNVDVFVERNHILHNINWTVEKGQNWAVLGENGSGKTTLLRCIWGDEHPALGGEMAWFGHNAPINLPRLHKRLGLVSDRLQATIPAELIAEDIVTSGFFTSLDLYEKPSPAQRAIAMELMQAMHLAHLQGRTAGTLSYGQLRRLLLARALVHKPEVLLLDEPCSGLDNESRTAFLQDVAQAARKGKTQVIHITHRTDDLAGITTHALYLNKGRISYCGVYPRPI